jgi:hypothetical protein
MDESGAAFSPSSWLVFEPFEEEAAKPFRAAMKMQQRGMRLNTKDSELIKEIARVARTRTHEWHHYVQHSSTGYGLLRFRLDGGMRDAAAKVLDEQLAHRGAVEPLKPLMRRASGAAGTASPEEVSRNLDAEGLSRDCQPFLRAWSFADDVRGALVHTTHSFPFIAQAWSIALGAFCAPLFGGSGDLRVPDIVREDGTLVVGSSPSEGAVSAYNVIEGAARLAEILVLGDLLGSDAWRTWPKRADRSTLATILLLTRTLDIDPWHPLVTLVHDLALAQTPDIEMVQDEEVLVWEELHPGHAFERLAGALMALDGIPKHMTWDEVVLLVAKVPELKQAYDRVQRLRLPGEPSPADAFLRRRDYVAPYGGEASEGPAECYLLWTLATGLALRAELPVLFAVPRPTLPEELHSIVSQITAPAFIVTPTRVNNTISSAAHEVLELLYSRVHATVLEELTTSGQLARSRSIMGRIRTTYGQEYCDALETMWRRHVGEHLGAHVADYARLFAPQQ